MTADLDQAWAEVQEKTTTLDGSIIEAEYATRQAITALRGFRRLKTGSNLPSDIHYPLLVDLMLELEKIVAL